MTDFDLFYINLDRATERRALIEQSFAASNFSSRWTFNRFPAFSKDSDLVRNATGKLSDAYKGNYFSHVECVRRSIGRDRHLFMAEDDLQFCPQTGPMLEKIIDSLPEDGWDIIHCEITLMSAKDFPMFFKLDRQEGSRGKLRLIDLGSFPYAYAGSGAYIVNRRAKQQFVAMMDQIVQNYEGRLDQPFDICLRGAIKFAGLRGLLTFPFLTAPSTHADQTQAPFTASQERVDEIHLELINAFRRLLWVGYSPQDVLPPVLAKGGQHIMLMSERDKLFQQIMPWLLYLQYDNTYTTDFRDMNVVGGSFDCVAPNKTDQAV